MTPSIAMARIRPYLPLALFAVVIATLCLNAAMSLADLMSSRTMLAEQTELLAKLKARRADANTQNPILPENYVFELASQGLASAEFQRRIADLLASANADLQLSEIIPPDPEGDVGRLAIAVNFEVDEPHLIDLLHAVENANPALVFERFSLRTASVNDPLQSGRLQGTATIVSGWRPAP